MGEKQFSLENELCKAISNPYKSFMLEEILNLTSMDSKLDEVLEKWKLYQ